MRSYVFVSCHGKSTADNSESVTVIPMHASGIGKVRLAEMPRRDVERILQKKGLPEFTQKP